MNEKDFELFWKKFIDDNGFPSYPSYEDVYGYFKNEVIKFLKINYVPKEDINFHQDNEYAVKYTNHNETIDILIEKLK